MLFSLATFALAVSAKTYCSPSEDCWPTASEITELSNALDPTAERVLAWDSTPSLTQACVADDGDETPCLEPRVTAVPAGSPDDQPLYGFATTSMDPVYTLLANAPECYNNTDLTDSLAFEAAESLIETGANETLTAFVDGCFTATRNNAYPDTQPGFVVWALTAEHVQSAVKFAVAHNLCIAVAGTGHDFMSRHECENGMMIRTTMLKGLSFDLLNSRGYRAAEGSVRAGAGIVFSEIQQACSDRGVTVAEGWAATVGIAGWTLGGGHGPIGNYAGLGVDNLLEAEIVTADGSLIRANSTHHSDLFWALRGGGGSTWGIVTEFTIRTHKLPEGGLTFIEIEASGDYCTWKFWKNGANDRDELVKAYFDWSLTLDKKWSGLAFITPSSDWFWNCDANWSFMANYWFYGPKEDALAQLEALTKGGLAHIRDLNVTVTPYISLWKSISVQPLQSIIPNNWTPDSVPSVLVSRDQTSSGNLANVVIERLEASKSEEDWQQLQLYQDITGNTDAPQPSGVSISRGFRTALFHFVTGWATNTPSVLALGENSYMNEMYYAASDWKQRQWGSSYNLLLRVKQTYDPTGVFWCRHCVGDDDTALKIRSLGTALAARFV